MARTRWVTRTIKGTSATVKLFNPITDEISAETVFVQGHYTNDTKLLEIIKAMYETNTCVVSAIIDKCEVDTLYRMDEKDFIRLAEAVKTIEQ